MRSQGEPGPDKGSYVTSAAGRSGLLGRVREAHAVEADREALCALCRHRGRHHTTWGCGAVECECRVPVRLVRCVVVAPDAQRWRLTSQGWDRAELVVAGVATADELADLDYFGEPGDVS